MSNNQDHVKVAMEKSEVERTRKSRYRTEVAIFVAAGLATLFIIIRTLVVVL